MHKQGTFVKHVNDTEHKLKANTTQGVCIF